MYDISLYGHLVFDTINDCPKTEHEIGGIVNVWRALNVFDPTLKIYVCPTNIGTSTITIDKKNSQRTSKSQLNLISVNVVCEPTVISHIAYVNYIDDLSFLEEMKADLIFADICSGKEINKEAYKYLDYIFVSEEDAHLLKDIEEFDGVVITHSPMKSYTNKDEIFVLDEDRYIKGVNVLGAGDYYAAHFIYQKLHHKSDYQCMIDSHISTTNYLKNKL